MSRIFSGVLQMSIAAAWMIPVVMVLRLLLKRAPKWVNLVLWGLVGLRLVCPFVPESRFSLMPKLPILSGYLYGNMIGNPAGNVFRADTLQNGTNFSNNISQAALDGSMGAAGSGMGGAFGITGSGIGAFGAGVWRIPERLLSAFSILWLAGVILFTGYAVYSYARVRRQVAEAMWLRENLWICDEVKSPFILGLRKPKIYLSSSMDEVLYPYVIAHEQAHLKRGDQWWKPLGFLILAIHWFQPFVWVAYLLFCNDLELACDESAVKKLNPQERKDYSYALLSCSMQRRLVTVCPLAFGEVGVKKRVKEILNYKKPTFWVVLAAVAVCGIVAVCFLTNPKQGTTPLLPNEAGKSENGVDTGNVASVGEVNAQQETDAALQEALDKQREQVEAVKEAIAAEKEKQASENSAGWVPIQQNDNATALMNMQDGATTGFVAVKGDASYAQVKVGDTTLLLLSDGIYQDGEHTYAMYCDVYGIGEDRTPVQIGKLLSEGTAYPICVGTAGLYVASGHSIEVYNLDTATGQLVPTGSNTESFDENGNATYYRLDSRGQRVESTEEEYLQAWEEYRKDAQPVEFTTQ